MTLQDILDHLSYGELSQLYDAVGECDIDHETKRKFVFHIQLGLTALYRRFRLKISHHTLVLEEDKTLYVIPENRLIKIEEVVGNDKVLILNRYGCDKSLFVPSSQKLLVPKNIMKESFACPKISELVIRFREDHPLIDPYDAAYAAGVEIELPDVFLEALLYFVAGRILAPIGMRGDFHMGNNYISKYELTCAKLEAGNNAIDFDPQEIKLTMNGFI